MILSGKTIRKMGIIDPCVDRQQHEETGMSFGVSMCGYDVRLDEAVAVQQGFTVLASTLEKFDMPKDVVGVVHDKSTNARRGLFVQNTVIEPGWKGFLTLELSFLPVIHMEKNGFIHPQETWISMPEGTPIAQILFHRVDEMTEGYGDGKYQNQERGPQHAR